jgi:hypothetical protein
MGHNRGGDNRRARLKRHRREAERLAKPETPRPASPALPKEPAGGAKKGT